MQSIKWFIFEEGDGGGGVGGVWWNDFGSFLTIKKFKFNFEINIDDF